MVNKPPTTPMFLKKACCCDITISAGIPQNLWKMKVMTTVKMAMPNLATANPAKAAAQASALSAAPKPAAHPSEPTIVATGCRPLLSTLSTLPCAGAAA